MYPRLEINTAAILNNLNVLKDTCEKKGISFVLVTKVLAGNLDLVKYLVDKGNVEVIADSRIKNLSLYRELAVQKWLIRSPMLSEVEEVVEYCDVSFNSEISVIRALNEVSKKKGKKHKVIFMCEIGDLREGCYYDELVDIIGESLTMEGIEVYGIGANLSCLNITVPDKVNMNGFTETVSRLEKKLNVEFRIVSAAASSGLKMLFEDSFPARVNNLRLGEGVFLGNIPMYDEPFPGAVKDGFVLKAEIIELKFKPAAIDVPVSDKSAFRKRAVLALGKQDVNISGLTCFDDKVSFVGASSDHFVVDVTDSDTDYSVGDIIGFHVSYGSLLSAMTTGYIEFNII